MKTEFKAYIIELENKELIEFHESKYVEGKTVTLGDLTGYKRYILNSELNSMDRILYLIMEGDEDFIEIKLINEEKITINRNKIIYIYEEIKSI